MSKLSQRRSRRRQQIRQIKEHLTISGESKQKELFPPQEEQLDLFPLDQQIEAGLSNPHSLSSAEQKPESDEDTQVLLESKELRYLSLHMVLAVLLFLNKL